jgi:hypothetical protein
MIDQFTFIHRNKWIEVSLFLLALLSIKGNKKGDLEYQTSGYQVGNKWLKDREQRKFPLNDIKHYCASSKDN